MTDQIPLAVLHEGDSEEHANEIWRSLAKRAEAEPEVEIVGKRDSPEDAREFRWKELNRAEIHGVEGNRDRDDVVPDLPHVEIRCDMEPFERALEDGDEPELAAAAVDLLELVEHAYASGPGCPRFVYAVSQPHRSQLEDDEMPPPVTAESLAEDRIEYTCWLMGFPPSIVETYERDTLLSAPAWQTSELSDGGIVILTTQDPTNVSKPEARAIDQHLDLDPPDETEECRY